MDDVEQLNDDAVTEILDRIPGAFEKAVEGRDQAERGEVFPLEDLGESAPT